MCWARAESLLWSSEQPDQENTAVPAARQRLGTALVHSEGSEAGCASSVPAQVPAEGSSLLNATERAISSGPLEETPSRARQRCSIPSTSCSLAAGTGGAGQLLSVQLAHRAAGPGCRARQHSPAHPFKAQQCPHHRQWLCRAWSQDARSHPLLPCDPHLSEVGSESWQEHGYLQGCAAQTPLLCLCCSPVHLQAVCTSNLHEEKLPCIYSSCPSSMQKGFSYLSVQYHFLDGNQSWKTEV